MWRPTFTCGLALGFAALGVAAQVALETPRTIRVVMDNAYAPYAFQSPEGELEGIVVDQWLAWQEKTGIKVAFNALDWEEALRRMRAGEFDVIDCIVETAERHADFDFTPAYATVEASIYFRKDIAGITGLASLKGFPVGVKKGDQHVDKLMANGVTNLILFKNNDAIVEAAKARTINVFVVDDPSAIFLLNQSGIEADFRHSAPIFRDGLRRAVRKGNAATLRAVTQGFAALEPRKLRLINEKWFGRTIDRFRSYLAYGSYAAAVAIVLIAGLVGWNRTLRKGVLRGTAELRALSARLVDLQESERRHLSRELHDRVGQDLTALKINLGIIQPALASSASKEARARLDDSAALVDSTMDAIRNVLYELRPPMLDDLGLAAALGWHAREFSRRTRIAVSVRATEPSPRPPAEMEIALFRIAQEALNNVAKHARAGRVDIALEHTNGECVMTVEDDGIGFRGAGNASDKGNPGLGMVTMRERAQAVGGRFEVRALPRGGTRLAVRIPC